MKISLFKIVLLILTTIFALSLYRSYKNYNSKLVFVKEAENELNKELDRKKELVSEYAKSQDYLEIENTIREKLNLSKPGELVYIINRPSPSPTPSPTIIRSPIKQWINLIW